MGIDSVMNIGSLVLDVVCPEAGVALKLAQTTLSATSHPAIQVLQKLVKAGAISQSMFKQLMALVMAKQAGQPGDTQAAAGDRAAGQSGGTSSASQQQQVDQSLIDNAVQMTVNGKKKKGAGSWYEALAQALGQALDAQAAKVEALASQITDANAKDKPSTLTQLQSESQRLSFMMNTVDQILKTIGEALAAIAKKN
jgi:hypothetical protein